MAGAFCALVVMAVGTEDDPGVIAAGKFEPRKMATEDQPEGTESSRSNNWWFSDDASAEPERPAEPEPEEDLPPGFGAEPSPEELT